MHFFIDPSALVEQPEQSSYGPVDDSSYNITATFSLSKNTEIFACQDCMMIVQPYKNVTTGIINNNLVNVILKPKTGPGIVQYYIYRGVDKSSFISGTDIVDQNSADKTEFISKFWVNWVNYITDTNQPHLIPTPANFGFDPSLGGGIFLEQIFNAQIPDVQTVHVSEGEWIGRVTAGNEINFEIIIDTDHLTLDLAYAQKSKHIIDVCEFQIPNSTPEDKFILKAEREKILNYIDPAAFFGLHYNTGIGVSIILGGTKTTVTKEATEIYTEILSKFFTKNRVYLDIRSEKGYSYNYYNNYGDSNQYVVYRVLGTTHEYIEYEYWPILWLSEFQDTIHDNLHNSLIFKLRIDDNIEPLLFVENEKLLGEGSTSRFIQEIDLLNGIDNGWTKEIKLLYPNYTDSSNPAEKNLDVACYIKLQYFRQKDNSASPNTVLKGGFHWDAALGGIHIPAFRKSSPLGHTVNNKRLFFSGSNCAYVAENGFFNGVNGIVFYAKNSFLLKRSENVFPKINAAETNSIIDSPALKLQNIVFNKWQVNDGTENIDIVEWAGNKNQDPTHMEDVFFLGLIESEVDILDDLTNENISNLHHKYFLFEEIPNQNDAITNIPFKKYKLKVQGLDNTGIVKTDEPASPIYVYGSGLNMLCSKDFAANNSLSVLLPNPVMYRPEKNFGTTDISAIDDDPLIFNNIPLEELNSRVFFPTTETGTVTDINKIKSGTFPVIVIVHGGGHSYKEYNFLMEHLAMNGFIVVSIELVNYIGDLQETTTQDNINYYFKFDQWEFHYNKNNTTEVFFRDSNTTTDWFPVGDIFNNIVIDPADPSKVTVLTDRFNLAPIERAEVLLKHLGVIKNKFSVTNSGVSSLDGQLGLIGHSRGGEAIVLLLTEDDLYSQLTSSSFTVNAIFSLAPTNEFTEKLTGIPYFVLYGSKDGDIGLARVFNEEVIGTGFSLWDRATGREKTMAFVLGATHNGFVTTNIRDYIRNLDYFNNRNEDKDYMATVTIQQNILKSYTNAFFRKYLHCEESIWDMAIKGMSRPVSTIDDRRRTKINTQLLGYPSINIYKPETEDLNIFDGKATAVLKLKEFDKYSPHWQMQTILYLDKKNNFNVPIPINGINANNYNYLSIRMTKVFEYIPNLSNFTVVINNISYKVGDKLQNPDKRFDETEKLKYTKSDLQTIIIPLSEFQELNKSNITSIKLEFNTTEGRISFAEIEFINL